MFHHGSAALVGATVIGARGDRLRLEECRVPRIVARIRGCVVEAGRERSAVNESGGPGSLLDGDCWTTIAGSGSVKRRRRNCSTSS